MQRLFCIDEPRSPIAECFRTLRTNIRYMGVKGEIKVLLVSSALPGEGKTSVLAELAAAFAQEGKRVVVVDCDLRKPSLHNKFDLPPNPGLTSLLLKDIGLGEALLASRQAKLDVLPGGEVPPNPSELLSTSEMSSLLEDLKERYDLVLLDSPPLIPVTDAQILSKMVDAVILIIRWGKTPREAIVKAKGLIDHVGANLIGTVLNSKKVNVKAYYT